MIKSISIIFPIFNEQNRLHLTFSDISKFNKKNKIRFLEYIFVDDGSNDNTYKIINNFIKKNKNKNKNIKFRLIKLEKNKGKGYALKKGIAKANNDWILTIDTDISVSLLEINNWVKKKYLNKKNLIYFGSRNLKKSKTSFKPHRKILGKIFSFMLNILFGITIADTQCGFKLYKKITAKIIFKKIKDHGYVHDVEVILIARKLKYFIKEIPITWIHRDNSKLNIFYDPILMLLKLLLIKKINLKL